MTNIVFALIIDSSKHKMKEVMNNRNEANSNDVEHVKRMVKYIHDNDYYVDIWDDVKHEKSLERCSFLELLRSFNDMERLLPNVKDVQRFPGPWVADLSEQYEIELEMIKGERNDW